MKVGIIGAMESEVALLKEQLSEAQVTRVAGMEFCEGALGGHAGRRRAVRHRQGQRRHLRPGARGPLWREPRHQHGRGRLARRPPGRGRPCGLHGRVWHDFDVTPLGYRPGEIPGVGTINFPADEGLREATLAAAAQVAPDIHAYAGRVVSGDQFIASAEQKNRITEGFGGMCCEMEGTAIAQAAWLNEVPFVVVRSHLRQAWRRRPGRGLQHLRGEGRPRLRGHRGPHGGQPASRVRHAPHALLAG